MFDGRDEHQIFSSKAAGADHVHSHAAKQRVYVGKDAEQGLLFVGCPKKKPMVVVFDAISGKKMPCMISYARPTSISCDFIRGDFPNLRETGVKN